MLPVCAVCKKEDASLKDIRGDIKLEGEIIAEYPEVSDLSETEQLMVCEGCINKAINKEVVNIPASNASNPIQESESIRSEQSSILQDASLSDNLNFDLNLLNKPGEIEKLFPDNPSLVQNIRNILTKAMPATSKKRKIKDLLPAESQHVLTNNGSHHDEINDDAIVEEVIESFLKQPPRKRRFKENGSNNSSLSSSENYAISSQEDNNSFAEMPPPNSLSLIRTRRSTSRNESNNVVPSRAPSIEQVNNTVLSRAPSIEQVNNDSNPHSNSAAPRRVQRVAPPADIEYKRHGA